MTGLASAKNRTRAQWTESRSGLVTHGLSGEGQFRHVAQRD